MIEEFDLMQIDFDEKSYNDMYEFNNNLLSAILENFSSIDIITGKNGEEVSINKHSFANLFKLISRLDKVKNKGKEDVRYLEDILTNVKLTNDFINDDSFYINKDKFKTFKQQLFEQVIQAVIYLD